MPARWASSERPLFVRTVWADGQRHAILSRDDPLRAPPPAPPRRPRAAQPPPCCDSRRQLERCLVKLRLVLHAARAQTPAAEDEDYSPPPPPPPESPPPFSASSSSASEQEQEQEQGDEGDEELRWDAGLPPQDLNPLSQRVLQWLDLAAKSGAPPPPPPPPPAPGPEGRVERRGAAPARTTAALSHVGAETALQVVARAVRGRRRRQAEAPPPEACASPRRRQLHIFMPVLARDADSASDWSGDL